MGMPIETNWEEIDIALNAVAQSQKRGSDEADKIAIALAAAFRIDQNQASEKWNLLIRNGNPDEVRFLLTSVYRAY